MPGANGSHSQICPVNHSSPDNQVFQGVRPPAQLLLVPPRIRYASWILPLAANRIAPAPPPALANVSEFET